MASLAPIVVALITWWSATALLLVLSRLPKHTYKYSVLGATMALGGAAALLEYSLSHSSVTSAYLGFVAAILMWGWLEMTYLMGFLTGSERRPCPEELKGWQRFVRAVNVGIYHELAVIVVGVTLITLSWDTTSKVAAWTFCVLWFMRWSAKLNLYFGVANLSTELLPERMRYMVSYMSEKPMNLLFPVSITLGMMVALHHAVAHTASTTQEAAVASALLCTITVLGVLEHWFLVLPIKDSALFRIISAAVAAPGDSALQIDQSPLSDTVRQ